MNQKIKELITQVGTDTSGKWINVTNAEQFVELIVRECALLAETAEPYQSSDLIKKHFGIE